MTIEITGASEPLASDPPDILQQAGVQTQDKPSDKTVLITEAQVGPKHCGSNGRATEGPAVGCAALIRIFVRAPGASRPKRRPYRPRMAYLEHSLMASKMERL
jgi:hypothetical protein